MRRLRRLFNRIMESLGRRRASRPEDIPAKLDAAALENALQEARFLYAQAVDVKPLSPGELPLPRKAEGDR
ncbi:MAG: hypothetical protein KGJ06_01900 [Pseudomonadota bacterium]|nr:hypothetical protein [Pseudomonadota bacterium]